MFSAAPRRHRPDHGDRPSSRFTDGRGAIKGWCRRLCVSSRRTRSGQARARARVSGLFSKKQSAETALPMIFMVGMRSRPCGRTTAGARLHRRRRRRASATASALKKRRRRRAAARPSARDGSGRTASLRPRRAALCATAMSAPATTLAVGGGVRGAPLDTDACGASKVGREPYWSVAARWRAPVRVWSPAAARASASISAAARRRPRAASCPLSPGRPRGCDPRDDVDAAVSTGAAPAALSTRARRPRRRRHGDELALWTSSRCARCTFVHRKSGGEPSASSASRA